MKYITTRQLAQKTGRNPAWIRAKIPEITEFCACKRDNTGHRGWLFPEFKTTEFINQTYNTRRRKNKANEYDINDIEYLRNGI